MPSSSKSTSAGHAGSKDPAYVHEDPAYVRGVTHAGSKDPAYVRGAYVRGVGVSFVIPVHNGAEFVEDTLRAVREQADGRPFEVIVVEDHSTDNSWALLESLGRDWPFRLLASEQRGVAAALNQGIRAARHPVVCQIDQDVVLEPGWMVRVLADLDDGGVAAVQGYYVPPADASAWVRVMALDLQDRYRRIRGRDTDHVCTGNVAYRVTALHQVGLFDERLGYGSDNDLSYRLRAAGYRLLLNREARSVHRWRDGLFGYLSQQYGFGYGRLDLVSKHPRRWSGDTVSPFSMMAHPLVMALALVFGAAAAAIAMAHGPWVWPALVAVGLVGVLFLERVVAGVRAWLALRDAAAFWFPLVHLLRDLAWVAAMTTWAFRRVLGHPSVPSHSMSARQPVRPARLDGWLVPASPRILGVLPAHNEVLNLPAVISELKRERPDLHLLVVDDGSTDGTERLLADLGVAWLRWPHRRGIGAAIRAGLLYASRLGFDIVVRVDADGQHGVSDIDALLRPINEGRAEVVLGTRYAKTSPARRRVVGIVQRGLAGCLSVMTGGRVTDPTSGFCAFGPRAIALLAEHHPDGYPEPELRLFLSRNSIVVAEVPVADRARLSGRTSLTWSRILGAGARVVLAILVVPFRPTVTKVRD